MKTIIATIVIAIVVAIVVERVVGNDASVHEGRKQETRNHRTRLYHEVSAFAGIK